MRSALLAAAGAVALCGLSAAHASLGPRYGEELTIALELSGGLEPRAAHTAAERLALGLVHETLVQVERGGSPRPSLAAAWSASASGREWTLRLDERARFHDGAALTAPAAAASLRRFLRTESSAAEAIAQALEGGADFRTGTSPELRGLDVADEHHITLRLSRPSNSLLPALASPAAAIRSEAGQHGAGAFSPVLDVPGRRLLVRAHLGHVRGRPFLERVLLVNRARDPLAEAGFAAGGAPSAQALLVLVLDRAKPPFDSPDVRAAVHAVIDRADLARRLLGGVPRLALSDLEPRAPERSSVRRAPAALSLAVEEQVPPAASQRLVALLASLGMRADVSVVPGAEVRRADASARLLLFLPEVDDLGLLLREAATLARADGLAGLLDAADAEPHAARRRALLRDVEQRLLAERSLLPLALLPVGIAAPEGTHGLRFDGAGRLVVEDAWREPR